MAIRTDRQPYSMKAMRYTSTTLRLYFCRIHVDDAPASKDPNAVEKYPRTLYLDW
jgi:hypothetical protein